MHLANPIIKLFDQIQQVLNQLTDFEYSHQNKALLNATIGQHVRHIIELYIELNNGYESGVVNYELRKRSLQIETNKSYAVDQLSKLANSLNKADKNLLLETDYSLNNLSTIQVQTNYFRELIYNLEHTVHHMALIKVALFSYKSITVDNDFGVAVSTIKHKKDVCVQ
jgi:hypothetical protein